MNTMNYETKTATACDKDQWAHRSMRMQCATCMWWVEKAIVGPSLPTTDLPNSLGRCRRHAPTISGFPAVFARDWCGDHRLDENKI